MQTANSWVIQRIGLQDFWYYDDEEFHFVDGRLLLRGSNGSGKSVTTQSFIPLLLDGNKSAQRLDAFGSKERKMINYLLEEGDDREERTGYLYMEFKRKESDTYLTIGMANRAKKNGTLTSWYFYIQDGRRIHIDFDLYRDAKSRIALSQKELENRIGDGGAIITTQKEYMEKVNDLLFGFDHIDSYQELLTLLIQIRQPKLSKDFKPTKLNEILSSSLTPLSEEDLRPMSEAVENMDTIQSNLEALKASLKASDKIAVAYAKYNQKVVYDKAFDFYQSVQKKERLYKDTNQVEKTIITNKEAYEKAESEYNALDNELQTRKEEERNLRANVAFDLKEKMEELQTTLAKEEEQRTSHEQRLEQKQEKEIQLHQERKHKDDESLTLKREMDEILQEMDEVSNEIFPPHEQILGTLKTDFNQAVELSSLQTLAFQQQHRISNVVASMKEKQQNIEILKEQENALEEQKTKRDYKEKEIEKLERYTSEVKQELIENINIWDAQNTFLHIQTKKTEMLAAIASFDVSQSYFSITDILREEKELLDITIKNEKNNEEIKYKEIQKDRIAAQANLQVWIDQEDPEPQRDEHVLANRRALDEKGISYTPLYKVIEFHPNLDAQACDMVEATLEAMGLLDALIINEMDKEVVLSMPNANDRYIFANKDELQDSILSLLEVDTQINDIFLSQQINAILESISMQQGSTTYLHADGRYGLGILHGKTVAHQPSRFIGYRSRQRYRNQKIQEFEAYIAQRFAEEEVLAQRIKGLNEQLQTIIEEFKAFPDGKDLQESLRMIQTAENDLKALQSDISIKQASLTNLQQRVNKLHLEITEKQKTCGIDGGLDAYQQAEVDMQEYMRLLGDFRQFMQRYETLQERLASLLIQHEEIKQDIDEVYHQLHIKEQTCRQMKQRIEDIRTQLASNGYEEIQQRIDICVERLNEIPKLKETLHGNILLLDDSINQLQGKLETLKKEEMRMDEEFAGKQTIFVEETRLGFLDSDVLAKDDVSLATYILDEYAKMEEEDLQNCFQQLSTRFHENKEYLMEYNLMQDSIFEQGKGKRILLTARIVGVKVSFYGLYHRIQEDIEIQELLLSNKERELFEDILANTLSKKIRYKIQRSENWAQIMNDSMDKMKISSDLKLSLIWKSKQAEEEGQLDTKELVQLLKQDHALMSETQIRKLSQHFRSKLNQARKQLEEKDNTQTLYSIMKDVFDYRNWFEFQLFYEKGSEKKKELTNGRFLVFSGGEKAVSMYVPLFSAAVAKYSGARADAPYLMALDEAFAGVDDNNMANMFEMMSDCHFQYILNSQSIWGDFDTNPGMAIYQLEADSQARFVTTMPYIWNGKKKIPMEMGNLHG